MHIYLDGPKFLSEEQLEKNTKYAYAKTMLHAEFFCNILCCDYFFLVFYKPNYQQTSSALCCKQYMQ